MTFSELPRAVGVGGTGATIAGVAHRSRELTGAQTARLDRFGEGTRVVGWSAVPRGPIVVYPNGLTRIVMPNGRLAYGVRP